MVRLRVTGTRAECDVVVAELLAATAPGVIREVSGWYANRPPSQLGRVYLDLDLALPTPAPVRSGAGTARAAVEPAAARGRGRRSR